MIPVGVIGVGYLGRFHAQKYAAHPRARLIGVYDPDIMRAQEVAAEVGSAAFPELTQLLDQVRAVSIAAPTTHHYALAKLCLEAGVHILMEKPLTLTLAQADELVSLQQRTGLVLAVGHLKRFHPAVDFLRNLNLGVPCNFNAERFAPFTPRSLDVDVILDLMVHDLDLAQLFIGDLPSNTQAIGASVMTDKTDVAHAVITFQNRALATLSASRVSEWPARRLRLHWDECLACVDFLENKLTLLERKRGNGDALTEKHLPLPRVDLLWQQIDAFLGGTEGGPVACDGREAREALALALTIGEAVTHGHISAGLG